MSSESKTGGNGGASESVPAGTAAYAPAYQLHPAWRALICFCKELRHGEIHLLRIQDGVPVLAELTKKKVRF